MRRRKPKTIKKRAIIIIIIVFKWQKYHIKNQQLKYYLLAKNHHHIHQSSNDSQLHSSINNSQSPHTFTSPSSIHVSPTPPTLSPTPPPLPKPIYDTNTCNCVCREEINLKEQIQHIEASLLILLEQNTIISSISPFTYTNLMNAHVPYHLNINQFKQICLKNQSANHILYIQIHQLT